MPRDLAALVKGNADSEPAPAEGIMFGAQAAHDEEVSSKRNEVHPYTQTLTLRDVDACVTLEDLAFPPNERASRAKVSLSFSSRLSFCRCSSTQHPKPCLASLSTSRCHSNSCIRSGLSLLAHHFLGLRCNRTIILRAAARDGLPITKDIRYARRTQCKHMHYLTSSLPGIVSPTVSYIQRTTATATASHPQRNRPPNRNLTSPPSPQFQYRLAKCSELSLGIFTSSESSSIPTYASAAPVYSGAPARKCVLLGHIVATKTNGSTVDDSDMSIPSDDPSDPSLGNKEEGRTVAIHSLAVLPEFQHKGLGSTIMKAYLDRLAKQDVADRAVLIAHEEMITYYEKFGFKNKGKSSAQFGGGGWFDMVKEISDDEKEDY